MNRVKNISKKEKEGFTLIELLVVIAIIGVLASVVLASLNSAREKARDAKRVADIKQLQLAFELYFDVEGNVYPSDLTDVKLLTYIATVPKDPLGANYTYELCPNQVTYHLGAALERDGGFGLDADYDGSSSKKPGDCTGAWGADTDACSGTAGSSQGSHCYDVVQ